MPRYTHFVAVALGIASIPLPTGGKAPVAVTTCGPSNDAYAQGFMGFARSVLTKERNAEFRASLGLPFDGAGAAHFVQADSLCTRAAAAINRDRQQPVPTSQRVYLISVGTVYWVEDPTYMAGEYIRGLVLDSSLTTILGRPGR